METVTNLNKDTLEAVQDLIKINIDSSEGFKSAADQLENSQHLERYFQECVAERRSNANELARVVGSNAETPEDTGTIRGTVHRWWLEVRGALQSGDEHAILAEAERGEDAIKHRYEDLLKETAGSAVNDVLQRQYAGVKRRHDQVRAMRDARA